MPICLRSTEVRNAPRRGNVQDTVPPSGINATRVAARARRAFAESGTGVKRAIHRGILRARGLRIVSYPRSGRTWLRLMLHDLTIEPRFTHVGSKSILQNGPDEVCGGMEKYHRRPIIFLHREPRDVLVSYYHHCCRQGVWNGDLSSFIRDPRNGFERILAFNLGWIERSADFRAFMVVNYEALRAHPRLHLSRIVGFTRCPLVGNEDIDRAIANNTFDRMKERERSGVLRQRFGDRFTRPGNEEDHMIVRRGIIGSHRNELDADDHEFCEELLRRYDYQNRLRDLVARADPEAARTE